MLVSTAFPAPETHAASAISILRATPDHLDVVAELFDAYRQFYRQPPDLEGARTFIRERLLRKDSVILLALDAEAEAVGFTQLYPLFSSIRMQPTWMLNDLFVAHAARRRGVAQALLHEAHRLAIRAGVAVITLATEKTNVSAKALYESLGYERDDALDYYELTLPPSQPEG